MINMIQLNKIKNRLGYLPMLAIMYNKTTKNK